VSEKAAGFAEMDARAVLTSAGNNPLVDLGGRTEHRRATRAGDPRLLLESTRTRCSAHHVRDVPLHGVCQQPLHRGHGELTSRCSSGGHLATWPAAG